jgi:hypothetical protein
MKKKAFVLAVACSILFLASCNKLDDMGNPFQKKHPFLKELKHGTRSYSFYYDHIGFVDSISVIDFHVAYVYRVTHHGKKIDSVSLVQNGSLISTNGNIQYDSKGRITQYTYYPRYEPRADPGINTLTYDHNGYIKTIAYSRSGFTNYDTLTFNQYSNLIRWAQPGVLSTFTYDAGLNPLYYVDDLFVMVTEERILWEFIFSQHNSVTKIRQSVNYEVTNFQNQYDTYNRLVKKNIEMSSVRDSLEFRYLN